MSLQEFSEIFSLLAVQLRAQDADEATMRGYFVALKDAPVEAVAASAQAFAKEPDRRFFPTTAEWYQAAQNVTVETLRKSLPPARHEPWHHTCDLCEDTGWEPFECPGDATCGRQRPHYAHRYVRPCPCRPINQTWIRHNRFGVGA